MSTGPGEATDPAGLGSELARLFGELAPPGTAMQMPPVLRAHLRTWWIRRFGDQGCLRAFIDEHRDGVVITLRSAQHDLDAMRLLSPDILLVLHALDEDPVSLLAVWSQDRDPRELLALADVFGRPYE